MPAQMIVRKSASTAAASGEVATPDVGGSGAEEFAFGIVDTEETPGLTQRRPIGDELRKRRTGKVADKAVGLQFPQCPPLESYAGEPMDKVGASIINEEFGWFRHNSLLSGRSTLK